MTDETRQSPAETVSHAISALSQARAEIARLKVELASRNLRITGLEHALRPFAHIALARDDDAAAGDMISGPDLAITPGEVRAARRLLNLEQLTNSQPCTHCSGTGRALYFSEQGWAHEERECHVCRPEQLTSSERER